MAEPEKTDEREGTERLSRESSLPAGETASAASTSEAPQGPLGEGDDEDGQPG